MSEKKQVLYDLRTAYNGPFSVEDFYAGVTGWAKEKGFVIEPKKKLEYVGKNGKKIQWIVEIQSHLDDLHHGVIVLRCLFDNVREVVVKADGKKRKTNNADVFINIDAFVEAHVHGSFFQLKPVYYFTRALIDKYIYNFWSDKYDGRVNSDARELLKIVQSFFNVQKYGFQ